MINEPYYILAGEEGFKGRLLDAYLAAGYYRMMHTIFTTHYTQVVIEGAPMPVFWLRTQVQKIKENRKAIAIRRQCAPFTITIKKAVVTGEVEDLYSLYYNSIDFSTASTCYNCIHDKDMPNPFDSMMIEIRDNGILIAAGYFDLGQNSITGILNFYHPAYKKYSLGKYLMLKKIDYALANNMAWYYTGYIGTSFTKFDYKLFPDTVAIEVYLPVERKWVPYEMMGKPGLEGYWANLLKDEI